MVSFESDKTAVEYSVNMTLRIVRLFGPKKATRSSQKRLELADDSLQVLRSGKEGEIGTGKPLFRCV